MPQASRYTSISLSVVFWTTLVCSQLASNASAAAINFTGQLDVVQINNGGIYSATPLGTTFTGVIDDVTAAGDIDDGTTQLSFSCCLAAGGLSVVNDMPLAAEDAQLLNILVGSNQFSAGDLIDGVDIEGDSETLNGGRIEVGLSYVFAADTFSDDDLDNYPFDPAAVLVSLFFIFEEDAADNELYLAAGRLTAVPLPGAGLLLGTGSLLLLGFTRRAARRLRV